MELSFFYCKHCGKIIALVKDTSTPTVCCGEIMSELIPGLTDGAYEKHIPVIKTDGLLVSVTVGTDLHPMTDEHYVEWILLETTRGLKKRYLKPGDLPKADFVMFTGEKVKAAYEFCNLHKLWAARESREIRKIS